MEQVVPRVGRERASRLLLRTKAGEVEPPRARVGRQEVGREPGDPPGVVPEHVPEAVGVGRRLPDEARDAVALRPVGDVLVVAGAGLALREQEGAIARGQLEGRPGEEEDLARLEGPAVGEPGDVVGPNGLDRGEWHGLAPPRAGSGDPRALTILAHIVDLLGMTPTSRDRSAL